MNKPLQQRLESGDAPFAGTTLYLSPPPDSREAMVRMIAIAVKVLQRRHERNRLYVLNDWYEHDGYITDERPCSWDEIACWTQTPEHLAASCSGDWRVHTLVYSEDFGFCFRYWIDVDDDQEHGFDVCGDEDTLREIATEMAAAGVRGLSTRNAKECFRTRSCE